MNENPSHPILNPNTYLNYLQPTVASEYEVARDIFLVTFGALLWDILSSLPDDWTLIRTTKPSLVLFAYFSSRTCALAVVFMSTLATTGPVQNCNVMELIICIFWVFASGSSSYLFLKRVHAVFLEKRLLCHAFTMFWLAGIGISTLLIPGTLHDYHQIANTKHCINVRVKSYVGAAFIVPVVFDVSVFIATSYKILKFHRRTAKSFGWRTVCVTEALPHISRAILQGGQQYYMITNGINITRAVYAISPSTPPATQLLPLAPAVALTSAMACRVFRSLKLEALQTTEIGNMTTIQFADKERVNIHLPRSTNVTSVEVDLGQ